MIYKTVMDVFSSMNDVSFPYLILRNFEGLPDNAILGEHGDIDLLVYDLDHWIELFPTAICVFPHPRVRFKIPIGDGYMFFDVRYVGDDYYPRGFENLILNNRTWNENGFFTPNKQDHLVALVYHAVHHKCGNTYPDILGNATVEELLDVLQKTGIGWTQPTDKSVGAYNSYLQGATSVVRKEKGKVLKKQISYKDYSLLDNEARLLKLCNSKHVPKLLEVNDDEIGIEDCGEHLTIDNLPKDWKLQLIEIVEDLRKDKVNHNDINIDNLMIKDGIIKLIDWGWGSTEEEDISHYPDCLGQPNRSSWGPDDNYAMKKVLKQYQYQTDKRNEEGNTNG